MLRPYTPLAILALAACRTTPVTGTTSLTHAELEVSSATPGQITTPPVVNEPVETTTPMSSTPSVAMNTDPTSNMPGASPSGVTTPWAPADHRAYADAGLVTGDPFFETSFGPYTPENANDHFPETSFADAGIPGYTGSSF